jgi:hypothetical protein
MIGGGKRLAALARPRTIQLLSPDHGIGDFT